MTFAADICPVKKMTGTRRSSSLSRMRRTMVIPSRPGIETSAMMRSGDGSS